MAAKAKEGLELALLGLEGAVADRMGICRDTDFAAAAVRVLEAIEEFRKAGGSVRTLVGPDDVVRWANRWKAKYEVDLRSDILFLRLKGLRAELESITVDPPRTRSAGAATSASRARAPQGEEEEEEEDDDDDAMDGAPDTVSLKGKAKASVGKGVKPKKLTGEKKAAPERVVYDEKEHVLAKQDCEICTRTNAKPPRCFYDRGDRTRCVRCARRKQKCEVARGGADAVEGVSETTGTGEVTRAAKRTSGAPAASSPVTRGKKAGLSVDVSVMDDRDSGPAAKRPRVSPLAVAGSGTFTGPSSYSTTSPPHRAFVDVPPRSLRPTPSPSLTSRSSLPGIRSASDFGDAALTSRVAKLEKENARLKEEMGLLRGDLENLRSVVYMLRRRLDEANEANNAMEE